MYKMIRNQKGSLSIALVITIISLLSGLSLSSIAFRDLRSMRLQLDGTQQFHLLRSEVNRGKLVASVYQNVNHPPQLTTLPLRNVPVDFGSHRTLYTAKTKLNIHEDFSRSGYLIRSLITADRGSGSLISEDTKSPVKRYGENFIHSLKTLAVFHYFSDIDRALDDLEGNIRFFGMDVVNGRVHSNTDIWISRSGGGWPTFLGLVTTSGVVRVHPGGESNYPRDQVFQGGLHENYPKIVFDPTAELIRANGRKPFGVNELDNHIAFVTVEGQSFQSYVGQIIPSNKLLPVHSSYPPYGAVGDTIAWNTLMDTLWTVGPSGTLNSQSVWVPYELWISGNFKGKQSWGSAGNIYLKDDLTYWNTPPGQAPDNELYPNTEDYLGIISEKSIYIQYGYTHPVNRIRHKPNTNNIYIYAALCAMGEDGEPNQYGIHVNAGIFTFQYQFPKGSTPAQMWQGEWYDNIDLHRYQFPTSPHTPWPPGLDYPGYNPLWPEAGAVFDHPPIPNPHGAPSIVFLRGDINLFGSIAQRRRGYVRRSGNPDTDTNNDNPLWDIEEGIYGRHTGQASGYNKNYTFDTRFEEIGPPDFPFIKFDDYESDDLMLIGYQTLSWKFKTPPASF
jgi:hypothetical protein